MKIYLILGGIILVLGVACFIVIKLLLAEQKKSKQAQEDIQKLQRNIACLVKHAEEIAEIRMEKDAIDKQIEGAKSDEEIANIVDAIIGTNNNRVRK